LGHELFKKHVFNVSVRSTTAQWEFFSPADENIILIKIYRCENLTSEGDRST